MELTRLLVYLLAGLSARASSVNVEAATGVTEAITEDQRKVYLECRNPDYKKYIKCLMRPKRHHHTHSGNGIPETDAGHCLEMCLKKCELDHDCEKKCGHCMKRTKHKHQIITEYETSCESGNCNADDGLRTTNITTNIDINNIINGVRLVNATAAANRTGGNGGGIDGGGINGNGDNGGRGGNGGNGGRGRPEHCCPQFLPDCRPCFTPSASLIPQISLVPQITYGIGPGAAGGCAYNQWLCIQQQAGGTPRIEFPSQPDCSGCGNPLLRYRCDVSCYITQTANVGTPCKSPTCVGGST